jgi:hypothetical protein
VITVNDGHGGTARATVTLAAAPVAGTPTVNSATVATKTFSSSFLPSMASTTVFTNTTLDEIVGITGNLAGAWVGGDEVPYHFTNGTYPGGKRWATVQIQVTDSTYAKTVKVLLTQSGSNVDASVLYAKYANRAYTGVNFDSLIHATAVPIATPARSPTFPPPRSASPRRRRRPTPSP